MLYPPCHDRTEIDIWDVGRMPLATLTCLAEVIMGQGTLIYRALMHTAAGAIAAVVNADQLCDIIAKMGIEVKDNSL